MDTLFFGLSTAATGILVVFLGLALLIVCIYAMTTITGNKKAAKKTEVKPAPAVESVPAPVVEETVENDDALVAVIAAAIASVRQSEGTQNAGGFVVRRIKRIHSAPAWQNSAREEQMYGRM